MVLVSNAGWNWLAPLAAALGWVLHQIYAVVGSYGVAIVALAVLLRLALLPVSLRSARHQQSFHHKRADLAPALAEIRKRWSDDPDREYAETMALYRQHGLNPTAQLKGCLPLLIQLPLLLALYQLLTTSPELAGQRFLWIDDLTRPDALFDLGIALPYLGSTLNLLPLVMLLAQVDIARSMAAIPDGRAASWTRYLFPAVMLVLFYPFPAGCMLYWAVSNLGQAVEQRVFLK